jgi:nucleoside-diphosphate-sugar epimerase
MNKKILITGATGFLGSRLTKKLVSENWDVHIIVRRNSSLDQLTEVVNKSNFHCYEYEGNTESLIKLLKHISPEVVFHLASLTTIEHQSSQISALINSNILFSTQLCEAMRVNNITRLINTGTFWQHYKNRGYKPVNLYAATKQAFYDILEYYVDAEGFKAINLELFDTYGAHDPRPKILNLLCSHIGRNEFLEVSPGEQEINLVHVDDVVNAYIRAYYLLLSQGFRGMKTFSIASPETVSLKELVSLMQTTSNKRLNIKFGARAYRTREVMKIWSKGKPLPGWSCQVKLEDGLVQLIKIKSE